MLRRHFLAITELDLWRLTVQQMRRDAATAEMDKREAAAIRIREIRAALVALDKAIHEEYEKVIDPHITDAKAAKRLMTAAKRFAKSLE